MEKRIIFVYGTLKKGLGNHRVLEGATYLGTASTEPTFTLLHLGGFPGIIRGGETAVQGELYLVTSQTMMDRLDRLEGHPTFYERQPITVQPSDGPPITVEAYVLPAVWASRRSSIVSGFWPPDQRKEAAS